MVSEKPFLSVVCTLTKEFGSWEDLAAQPANSRRSNRIIILFMKLFYSFAFEQFHADHKNTLLRRERFFRKLKIFNQKLRHIFFRAIRRDCDALNKTEYPF